MQASGKKWTGDTFALLHHVYFETEPMKNVAPRDPLARYRYVASKDV
jgi:hypothetical protein